MSFLGKLDRAVYATGFDRMIFMKIEPRILLTGFAMLGCAYMAVASAGVWGLWQPHTPNDWIALALGIQALAMLLPTWIASWLEPRAIAGEED